MERGFSKIIFHTSVVLADKIAYRHTNASPNIPEEPT